MKFGPIRGRPVTDRKACRKKKKNVYLSEKERVKRERKGRTDGGRGKENRLTTLGGENDFTTQLIQTPQRGL